MIEGSALEDHLVQRLVDRALLRAMRWSGGTSRYHFSNGERIHTLEFRGQGSLPPVVMMHGLGSTGVHYAGLLRALRPHVPLMWAPDMPGHGRSSHTADRQADWLRFRDALDAHIHQPAVFFGNSLGGWSAIRYALERPQRVLGLMLVSPAGARVSNGSLQRFAATLQVASHRQALDFVDRLFAQRHPLRHLLAAGVRSRFNQPGVRAILEGLEASELLDPDALGGLSMPVRMVWGGAERILPEEQRDFFLANLPDHATVVAPPTFGHAPFIDHPRQVADGLLDFVREIAEDHELALAG